MRTANENGYEVWAGQAEKETAAAKLPEEKLKTDRSYPGVQHDMNERMAGQSSKHKEKSGESKRKKNKASPICSAIKEARSAE